VAKNEIGKQTASDSCKKVHGSHLLFSRIC